MNNFNPKNFNLADVIQKRANQESDYEWAKKDTRVPTPKFTKVEIKKDSAWWLMFFKNLLLEIRM